MFKRLSSRHSITHLKTSIIWLFCLCTCFSAFISLLTISSTNSYFKDLFVHFRYQYFLLSFIGLILFGYLRRYVDFALCLFVFLANGIEIYPYFSLFKTNRAISSDLNKISFFLANIHTENTDYNSLLQKIQEHNPTLVALLEIDSSWDAGLLSLKLAYPHHLVIPRSDNFGIALYSNVPLLDLNENPLGDRQLPSIQSALNIGEQVVSLLITHTIPPVSRSGFNLRNNQLESLAIKIKEASNPVVVLGDLNLTPWSSYYKELIRTAELVDPRLGLGILPTWPQWMPFMSIPIDYCLVSGNIRVQNLKTVKIPGSDHKGLHGNLWIGKN